MIKVKRVYDEPAEQDGLRVLVDRIWPRGLKKEDVVIDHWLKTVAPSSELRKWFDHDPKKWQKFRERYAEELKDKANDIHFLKEKSKNGNLTLMFAAKDIEHNNAVALKHYLES